jgi:lipopolysaccharide/colanic/teichoic acid biosynthesis glycosyltransferase
MKTLDLQIYAPVDRSVRTPTEGVSQVHPHTRERSRRVLNVAVAGLGLVATAPLMAVIAIAIKLTSPGPVLFKQVRVGLCRRTSQGGNFRRSFDYGGKPFTIYKFRTMRQATLGEDSQVWASKDDPRITSIGRFLRRTRLDELPQLFNVLRGEMNIVGPRPEQPDIFQMLRDEVSDYAIRQRVRPGITGRAQITLEYDSCLEDVKKKIAADLTYIERQSVLEDFRIMVMTVPVMLLRKGSR